MELAKTTHAASVAYGGEEHLVMPAEAHLRFQDSSGQGNFLDEVVPEGKQWAVKIVVSVIETDAA